MSPVSIRTDRTQRRRRRTAAVVLGVIAVGAGLVLLACQPPTEEPLAASVRLIGDQISVRNLEPGGYWRDCAVSVNGYTYRGATVGWPEPLSITVAAFTDSTGQRYDPRSEPPRSFSVTCVTPYHRAPFLASVRAR